MSHPTEPTLDAPEPVARFSDEARRAVYDVIALRRDVRQFRDGEVDDATLARILEAAHLAPSVGFSQPWGFVVVKDRASRARVRESFLRCREAEAARYPAERRAQYLAYRLEGILESSLNVLVVVDLRSRGEAILGTTAQPEAVRASACCAVENLWLAARAEGLGVGWVSIVEPAVLRAEFALPAGVEPIAYLCVGHAREFLVRPMLEETKWRARRPLREVVHWEGTWRDPHVSPDLADVHALPAAPKARRAFDDEAAARARVHQRELTKPHGSLGRLEEVAVWYAGAVGRFPVAPPKRAAVAIFAADHGVVVESVSAYGSQLTAAMVVNVMCGGAAINVLAHQHDVELVVVDVGVTGDLGAAPIAPLVRLERAPVRAGTANLRRGPAMARAEADTALAAGARVASALVADGVELLAAGEIGIGNTTAGAALLCVFAGADPHEVVGRGTGVDDATHARKIAVVVDALALHAPRPTDPIGALAAVGGLELAAMAGFYVRAAELGVPVVLDGFLSAVAALVAIAIDPRCAAFLIASHVSAERGGRLVLERLGKPPLFDLGMRLGEGTGAVLGIALVRTAVALQAEMATFATAGVVRARGDA